jgi:hypothetical protein
MYCFIFVEPNNCFGVTGGVIKGRMPGVCINRGRSLLAV